MPAHLSLFLLAVLTISLFPGPDMLYIISQSVAHGKRLGVAAVLGISLGCFVHIFAVTVGLTSLLYESTIAFTLVKFLGVAYFLYLGIRTLIQKSSPFIQPSPAQATASWRKSFLQGMLTNVFNPKVALFFLAFLPQFVTPSSDDGIGLQLLLLGLIFNSFGSVVNLTVALFFGSAQQWLRTRPKALKVQQIITGLILVGLGLQLTVLEKI